MPRRLSGRCRRRGAGSYYRRRTDGLRRSATASTGAPGATTSDSGADPSAVNHPISVSSESHAKSAECFVITMEVAHRTGDAGRGIVTAGRTAELTAITDFRDQRLRRGSVTNRP